jgi:hypothetical protein
MRQQLARTGGVVDACQGAASIARTRPWAVRWSASAVSSAASRPSRFISNTVKMTRQYRACALTSRAVLSASSNQGRTRTRVLIFSLKILSLEMPCLASASSWESSSCPSVEQRAYPMRMSALGRAGSIGGRGRGGHPQRLLQPGHHSERRGRRRRPRHHASGTASRAARHASDRRVFDVVRVRPAGRGSLIRGQSRL